MDVAMTEKENSSLNTFTLFIQVWHKPRAAHDTDIRIFLTCGLREVGKGGKLGISSSFSFTVCKSCDKLLQLEHRATARWRGLQSGRLREDDPLLRFLFSSFFPLFLPSSQQGDKKAEQESGAPPADTCLPDEKKSMRSLLLFWHLDSFFSPSFAVTRCPSPALCQTTRRVRGVRFVVRTRSRLGSRSNTGPTSGCWRRAECACAAPSASHPPWQCPRDVRDKCPECRRYLREREVQIDCWS